MDISNWYVKGDIFLKSFIDYVVEVKEVSSRWDFSGALPKKIDGGIGVTIWKGEGHEDTKHTIIYYNFEQAFKFVEEFSKQKFFDQAVEEYFGGPFAKPSRRIPNV